jgi:hypothetical protein
MIAKELLVRPKKSVTSFPDKWLHEAWSNHENVLLTMAIRTR